MPGTTAQSASDGFLAAFSQEPEGVWSAPGRVSLAGDHTEQDDGVVLGFAIRQRTWVAVRRRDDGAIRIRSNLSPDIVDTAVDALDPLPAEPAWSDYPLGVIWAAREYVARAAATQPPADPAHPAAPAASVDATSGGLDVFVTSDVPIGAGFASSASVGVALSAALDELWGLSLDTQGIARLSWHAEREFVGASGGLADHIVIASAEPGSCVFYDARGGDISRVPVGTGDGMPTVLVAVDTHEEHRNWAHPLRERLEAAHGVALTLGFQSLREVDADALPKPDPLASGAGEDAPADAAASEAQGIRAAHYIVGEIGRALECTKRVRTEGFASLGPLLRDSERSLRDNLAATTKRIDFTCELADYAKAAGARTTGAGLGGAVIVAHPADRVDQLTALLAEAYEEQRWPTPTVFDVAPSEGPRRDA